MPNDFGLFDILGNVWEWCQDDGTPFRPSFGGRAILDNEELASISERVPLIVRGGAYNYSAADDAVREPPGMATDHRHSFAWLSRRQNGPMTDSAEL